MTEEGVAAAVDSAFPALFRWLGGQGVEPLGPPFIRFLEIDVDGEPVAMEVAVPVAAGVSGDDGVQADALPVGRYVTLIYAGPYRDATEPDLAAARAALQEWAREQGIVLDRRKTDRLCMGCYVEQYIIGPVDESDYSKWETEMMYLTSEN